MNRTQLQPQDEVTQPWTSPFFGTMYASIRQNNSLFLLHSHLHPQQLLHRQSPWIPPRPKLPSLGIAVSPESHFVPLFPLFLDLCKDLFPTDGQGQLVEGDFFAFRPFGYAITAVLIKGRAKLLLWCFVYPCYVATVYQNMVVGLCEARTKKKRYLTDLTSYPWF